ncbi:MAG: protoheme synthesis HemY [Gammaproteobacteria bacterium]|nr:protoheme synthesis HemY [Gammaproteobacteria bacterium]
MTRVLLAFIILLGSVFLGIQLNHDPGYMLIAINHWTIETTVWVALFVLIFLFLFIHFFIQFFHMLVKTPSSLSKWNSRRLNQKAQATTRKGLIEYSEGYWQQAKKHLIQALPNTDTPLLNYLTAARAAQKMGDSQLRDHYLREAQQSMPEAKVAVELTQAQLQHANHQWEQALATLKHLHDLAPNHPYVLKLLINLYEQIRDWNQLIALLPVIKKHHVFSDLKFNQIQHNAYVQAMIDLSKQNQAEALSAFYLSLPKTLSDDPEIVETYVRFLLKNEEFLHAESILKRALRKGYNTQLINLYGLMYCGENQLVFAESLLKKNSHSASLYLCLGRLCIAQHLWGKAKHYLEQANEISSSPEIHITFGKLYEQLNDPFLASTHFKKGLELATNPL